MMTKNFPALVFSFCSASIPADGESLRATLVDAGLLPEDADGDPAAPLGWRELARDLRRARELGMRLPWSPVGRDTRRKDCHRELGVDSPAHDLEAIAGRRDGRPSRAAACLALADVAGDPPPAPKAPARSTAPTHRAG